VRGRSINFLQLFYEMVDIHHQTLKMPSKVHKVQKKISKKKGSLSLKSLNENSRDARSLRRAVGRDDRIISEAETRQKQNLPYCMKWPRKT
jgi:hypothetical protein